MNEKLKRSFTGIIFGITILSSLLISWYVYALCLFIFLILATKECISFTQIIGNNINTFFAYSLAALSFSYFIVLPFLNLDIEKILMLWLVFPFIVFFEILRRKSEMFINILSYFFIVFYLTIPFGFLALTRIKFDVSVSILLLAVVWLYDTSAYFAGISFGKHKMAENISPKKSWEGLIGGVVITFLMIYLINYFYFQFEVEKILVATVLIIFFSTLGDLFESILKRFLKVKDSGNILPGHGGVLDRFDSLLFAAPAFYFYWHFFN